MLNIEIIHEVNNAVEKLETTPVLYLDHVDLSKAFDTIFHDIILYKLDDYGFRGIVFDWFKSYLQI